VARAAQERGDVLGELLAEVECHARSPDGEVAGAVVVHPLAQGGVERDGQFGDLHVPCGEVVDRFLRPMGGVEPQRAARVCWPGTWVAWRVDTGRVRDPRAQLLVGLVNEQALAGLTGQSGSGKAAKLVQGRYRGRAGFGGEFLQHRPHCG